MRKLCLLLSFLALAVSAADLTGKWSGSLSAPGQPDSPGVYFDFKQNGVEVTGTGGPNDAERLAIRNGRLEGRKLTFEVVLPDERVFKFNLVYDGDSIKGEVTGQTRSGENVTATMQLKRTT